jgi:signal transduction histidine kinase
MRQFSIRQQVAGLTFIPLLIMAIGMETYFLNDRFLDMDKDLRDRGELLAHQLAAGSEYGVFSNNQAFLQNIAGVALQQEDVRGAVVLNSAHEVLASVGEFSLPVKSEIVGKMLVADERFIQLPFTSFEKMDHAIILQPPTNRNLQSIWLYHAIIPAQLALGEGTQKTTERPVGAIILEISKARHEGHKTHMLWTTLAATSGVLLLAFYLVYLASRSIVNPIKALSDTVRRIGEGQLDTRISLNTHVRELDVLAKGLNESTAHLQAERTNLEHRIAEATRALREKKEEAERASHGKSHFLAVASHDLRQPLHALGLYVAELKRRVPGSEQQHLVEQVDHSIEALSSLLNGLLDISKLDAGAVETQMQPCDLAAMLVRVASDFRMLANQRNIRLIVRPFYGFVVSDPQLLERMLINLVSNAIRYTRQDGCVLIACRKRDARLRIEVRDNGVGISEDDQANIFCEFFQVTQSHHGGKNGLDANKGLGLGLSIVEHLAKLLGCRIELRSKPGEGSVFAFEVQIVDQIADGTDQQIIDQQKITIQTSPDSADEIGHEAGHEDGHEPGYEIEKSPLIGMNLLVVDDDMAVLSGTSGLLRSWGCIVSQASSFAQVEQLLREGPAWDFIVSDYQLGGDKNGFDVIAMVRQHHNKPIPCVLISGDTGPAFLEMAKASGHPLLQKPVKPSKLRSLIVNLFAGRD